MGRTTPFMDNRKNGDEAFGSPRTVIRLSRYGRKARRFYDRGRLSRLSWESGSRSRRTGFDLQCIYLSYHWAALSETIMKLKQNFIEKSSKKTITIRSQCWCLYSTKGSTGERKVLCMIFHIFPNSNTRTLSTFQNIEHNQIFVNQWELVWGLREPWVRINLMSDITWVIQKIWLTISSLGAVWPKVTKGGNHSIYI